MTHSESSFWHCHLSRWVTQQTHFISLSLCFLTCVVGIKRVSTWWGSLRIFNEIMYMKLIRKLLNSIQKSKACHYQSTWNPCSGRMIRMWRILSCTTRWKGEFTVRNCYAWNLNMPRSQVLMCAWVQPGTALGLAGRVEQRMPETQWRRGGRPQGL